MSIPNDLLPTTCDVYRPFGAATATYTNLPCRLIPDLARGRTDQAQLNWTHYLMLQPGVDVLDGTTRTMGTDILNYADGDEIRVPTGASTPRFVVVWVETVDKGTTREYKRAFLMRHAA